MPALLQPSSTVPPARETHRKVTARRVVPMEFASKRVYWAAAAVVIMVLVGIGIYREQERRSSEYVPYSSEPSQYRPTTSISPEHQDRPVWAIAFDGIQFPIASDPSSSSVEPNYYTATLMVFVDADTGAFLLGNAI